TLFYRSSIAFLPSAAAWSLPASWSVAASRSIAAAGADAAARRTARTHAAARRATARRRASLKIGREVLELLDDIIDALPAYLAGSDQCVILRGVLEALNQFLDRLLRLGEHAQEHVELAHVFLLLLEGGLGLARQFAGRTAIRAEDAEAHKQGI